MDISVLTFLTAIADEQNALCKVGKSRISMLLKHYIKS